MLFDDEEQLEVRHVISLAHHDISIYSGGATIPEGELFIKKNALCLSRKRDGPEVMPDSKISKPFYLFSENCSAKEDFYFALLRNQQHTSRADSDTPSPKQFDVKNIISLVQKLHSSEGQAHTRWLNALLGRLFLAVYKTRDMENFVREKITKKISRVKKPSFLTNIAIQRIDTGEAAPIFTNLKLKDLTVEGECVVEGDVRYTGKFRIEVAATAKLDLGARFKAREINLVLAVVVRRVEGHVLFKIKPPPSNRIWFSFQTMPKLEMTIEPVVSSRQITYTAILRQIEHRIKEVFAETIVEPFWDDVPFFKTEHKKWRGGIFEGDDALKSPDDVETITQIDALAHVNGVEEDADSLPGPSRIEKSHSTPALEPPGSPSGIFGRKSARNGTKSAASGSSTSIDTRGKSSTLSRPLMAGTSTPDCATPSENLSSLALESSPSVADSEWPASQSQTTSSLLTPDVSQAESSTLVPNSNHSSSSSLRESQPDEGQGADSDGGPQMVFNRRDTASSSESAAHDAEGLYHGHADDGSGFSKSPTGSLNRSLFSRRDGVASPAAEASPGSDGATHKRNTLAAMTNAAAQAGQWGWSAIQRQKNGKKEGRSGSHIDLSQPMGRGQPLPPPGMPLPRPRNGKTVIAAQVPKRKPVPPPPLPERPSEGLKEHRPDIPRRPVSTRRRRGESQELEEFEHKMLVIAAPDESQPTTPATDEGSERLEFPMGEAASAPADEALDESALTGTQTGLTVTESGESDVPSAAHSSQAVPTEGDDDGYSGWGDYDEDVGTAMENKEISSEAASREEAVSQKA